MRATKSSARLTPYVSVQQDDRAFMKPVLTSAIPLARLIVAVAFVFAASACGPIISIGDQSPPPSLYTLRLADNVASVNLPSPILIDEPEASAELKSYRIPVRTSQTGIQFLSGARLVDPPSRLFGHLLEDRLSRASPGKVLGPHQLDAAHAFKLAGRLTDFHLDLSDGAPVARVTYVASLSSSPRTRILSTHRFTAQSPVASSSPEEVIKGMNIAANQIASDVTQWLADYTTNAAKSAK